MPRPRLPHLQHERTRHGRDVWYVRVGKGARIRLRAEYGSDDFRREYMAAVSGAPLPGLNRKPASGSLRWLVDMWRRSSDWAASASATRRQRENILLKVLEASGTAPYRAITAAHIREGRERRAATPFAANNFLKTMRALFRWAKEAGLVQDDPAAEVKFLSSKTEGFAPWTAEDVLRYRKRWPIGTRQRVAMEIIAHTGLRRGDAVRLGRQHVRDGVATLTAEKTGVTLYVPIATDLRAVLDAGPTGDLSFISGERGQPMRKESFGNEFRGWCNAAGVTASAHGLRKLAASSVANAGGTDKELMALFGWTTNTQSLLYTRAADNRALAIRAVEKLSKNADGPHLVPGAGEKSKPPMKSKTI